MTIASIPPFAASRAIFQPSEVGRGSRHCCDSNVTGALGSDHSDRLSVADPMSRELTAETYERASWKIQSQLRVTQSDDGQLTVKSQTRLRFSYDFEADDGTKIRIRAKLNLRYAQTTDSDNQSYSLRQRARTQVSILQQDVSSGVQSLTDRPEISAEAQDAIAQALQQFQQVADSVTSAFLESNPLDGDALIRGIVDAFNKLATSIDGNPLNAPSLPQETPASDSATRLAFEATMPKVAPTPEPSVPNIAVPVSAVPVSDLDEQLSSPPQSDIATSTLPATATVADSDTPVADERIESEKPLAATPDGPKAADTSLGVVPTANEQPTVSARSVMLSVRWKVVQSLTNLVGTFDSDSSSASVSHSVFRESAELIARYSSVEQFGGHSAARANAIDAQV